MSVHVVGSATISFGLVSVPVKLYSSADSSSTIAFNWLNKNTGARVKQQYVDAQSGEKVDKADMIKGYEFSKGQYVTFTPDDLKALDQKATNSIDIEEFIPLDKVDRIFLAKAYFLGPDKGGARAYHLLSEALTETGRAALGQYSSRGKQYLVLVRPMNGVLVIPDLTILLDAPVETAMARTGSRGNPDRLDVERADFYTRVRESYLQLAELEPDRFVVIDASGELDAVRDAIDALATVILSDN